jgi:hypothetical protein
MSHRRAQQQSNEIKKSKIIFNLEDVKSAPELIYGISENVLACSESDKKFSLFLVEYAQSSIAYRNYLVRKYKE